MNTENLWPRVAAVALGLVLVLQPMAGIARALALEEDDAATVEATGDGLSKTGDSQGALEAFTQALQLFQAADDQPSVLRLSIDIAAAQGGLGRAALQLEWAKRALDLAQQLGDRGAQGHALKELGAASLDLGQNADAQAALTQALLLARAVQSAEDEATDLGELAGVSVRTGDFKGAAARFEDSLAVAAAAGLEIPNYLHNYAGLLAHIGQLPRALDMETRALAIMQSRGDRRGEAYATASIGVMRGEMGEYDEDRRYTSQALAMFRDLGDPRGEQSAVNNLGGIAMLQGKYPDAADAFQQAISLSRQIQDLHAEEIYLGNLAQVQGRMGRPQEAVQSAQQALEIASQVGDRDGHARMLNELGTLYQATGQTDRGYDALQQALSEVREVGDRPGELAVLNNLTSYLTWRGDYAKAIPAYESALSIAEALGSPRVQATVLQNLAFTYGRLGERERGLEYVRRALALRRKLGDVAGEAENLTVLAGLSGDVNEVRPALERALEIEQTIGDRRAQVVTLTSLGEWSNLDPPRQLTYWQQALALARATGLRSEEGIILNNLGYWYERDNQLEVSLSWLQQAADLFRETGNLQDEVLAELNIAQGESQQGNLENTLAAGNRAVGLIDDLRSRAGIDSFKTDVTGRYWSAYAITARTLVRLGRPAEAFEMMERGQARSYLDQLGGATPAFRNGADTQLLEEEKSILTDVHNLDGQLRTANAARQGDAAAVDALRSRLDGRQRDYANLLQRIKLSNPALLDLASTEPTSVADIQVQLDSDTALVSYMPLGDSIVIFLVTRDAVEAHEVSVDPQAVLDAVRDVRNFADIGSGTPHALQDLYGWLVAPINAKLTQRSIGIVSAGSLQHVPYAALFDGHQYFGENHLLFTLPSASSLPILWQARATHVPGESALVLGQREAPGLPLLAHAEQEATQVAAAYGTAALNGTAATKAALVERSPTAGIIHLAAHAELDAQRPLFSRVLLAPDPTDAADTGALTVSEIYGLDLRRTDLVVLSACQTELGALQVGGDLVGLSRAFLFAGTPTVIASLWTVDDEATSVLMQAFYGHLHRGESKAGALRAAQAETRAKYPHPYYWAGFVLTGDPGEAAPARPGVDLSALALAGGAALAGTAALGLAGLLIGRRR